MRKKGGKEIILIAEHSNAIMVSVQSTLKEEGYDVLCAPTGEKAMELIELSHPDLILLNSEMFGIDDVNTCEIFKNEKAIPAIPIIFMMALDEAFDKAYGFECGVVDYITKPIDTQELISRVRTHLTIKQLRDELEDANRQLKEEIADSKKAQAELAKAHDELEAKVAHRTAEFILAKEAAETANKAKDAFIANMSHEMRTPLSSITGFTYLVMESDLSQKQREQMNYIKLSCDHLLSVINDILDLSKIKAGRLQLERTRFHLPTLVETVIATLAPKSQEKKLALSCHIEPNVPHEFIGDPTRLRQVLFNLIYNAIKFTASGEVRLRCRATEHTPIKTTLQFSVTDTGIGLSKEQFDRIFKRFVKADVQTQADYGGTGLGLSISKHLVELMGGAIWVESAPGSGSSFNFTVTFPIHHGTLHAVQNPGQSGSTRIASADTRDIELSQRDRLAPLVIEDKERPDPEWCWLDILVVEDDLINRLMAANILEKMGTRVTTAENGADALKTMERRRFDLVFMDVKMPVMDGIEATRRIRGRQVNGDHHIPIIAMTAHAMQGDSEKFLKAGMSDYISKPIDPETLLAKLRIWHNHIKKKEKAFKRQIVWSLNDKKPKVCPSDIKGVEMLIKS